MIAYDLRGSAEPIPEPFTLEELADDACAVLDAARVGRAHVLGWGMGGLIAQEVALSHPDRIISLVLVGTGPGGTDMVPPEEEVRAFLGDKGGQSAEDAIRRSIPYMYLTTTAEEVIDEDVSKLLEAPTPPQGYQRQRAAVAAWRGSGSRLSGLSMSALVLHGSADRMVPVANARILGSKISHASVDVVTAGHAVFTDAPSSVATVRDFIRDNDHGL